MDTVDWRTKFQPDLRQRIVNRIVDLLKKDQAFSGEEGLNKITKTAQVIEEKIYSAATSNTDYLREIKLKMVSVETKSQNTVPNSMPKDQVSNTNGPRVGGSSKNMRPAPEPNQGSEDLPPPPKKRLIDRSVPKLTDSLRPANHVPKHIPVAPDSRAAEASIPTFPYGTRPANHFTKHFLLPPPRPQPRADHLSPAPVVPRGAGAGSVHEEEISDTGRTEIFKDVLKTLTTTITRLELAANINERREAELRAVKAERDKLARDLQLAEEAKKAASAVSEREIKTLRETTQSGKRRYEAEMERLEAEVAGHRARAEEAVRAATELRSVVGEDPAAALANAFWDGVDYCKAKVLELYPDSNIDFGFLDAVKETVVATPQVEIADEAEHVDYCPAD